MPPKSEDQVIENVRLNSIENAIDDQSGADKKNSPKP